MSKERDEATYAAIMAENISPAVKCVYWVLWQYPDGLTRGEIGRRCAQQGWQEDETETWSKTVSHMFKVGLLEKGSKRHCEIANKEDQVWEITTAKTTKRVKAPKPSAKKYAKAVDQLEILIIHHSHAGDGMVTDELKGLFEWLKDKLPEDDS